MLVEMQYMCSHGNHTPGGGLVQLLVQTHSYNDPQASVGPLYKGSLIEWSTFIISCNPFS